MGFCCIMRRYYTKNVNRNGTRGSGRVGRMWSGRKRVWAGTIIPSVFRSRTRLPGPFPTLFSVPTVYHPDLQRLVPVPTVSRPAVMFIPGFSCPAVRPVVRIPSLRSLSHNLSHPATHLDYKNKCPYPKRLVHAVACRFMR